MLTTPHSITQTTRFKENVEIFVTMPVRQAFNRKFDRMLSVDEFLEVRHATFGAAMVEGEFIDMIHASIPVLCSALCVAFARVSLDLNIPDEIIEHPAVRAAVEAAMNIVTYPNVSGQHLPWRHDSIEMPQDLCSFNVSAFLKIRCIESLRCPRKNRPMATIRTLSMYSW